MYAYVTNANHGTCHNVDGRISTLFHVPDNLGICFCIRITEHFFVTRLIFLFSQGWNVVQLLFLVNQLYWRSNEFVHLSIWTHTSRPKTTEREITLIFCFSTLSYVPYNLDICCIYLNHMTLFCDTCYIPAPSPLHEMWFLGVMGREGWEWEFTTRGDGAKTLPPIRGRCRFLGASIVHVTRWLNIVV